MESNRDDQLEAAPNERSGGLVTVFKGDEAVPRWLAVSSAISVRLLIVTGTVYILGFAALHLLVIVVPLVVALLLSTLAVPPTRWLARRGVPRGLAGGLVVGLSLLALGGLFALVIPPFVSQVGELGESVREGLKEIAEHLRPLGFDERAIDNAIETLRTSYREVGSGVLSGAIVVAQGAASIVLTVMLLFFIVKDGDRLWHGIIRLFAEHRRPVVREMGERAWDAFGTYIRGVAMVATLDAVLIGLALFIIGVPLLFPLIILTFIAAFFPVVGAIVAGVVATLVALVGKGVVAALITAGIILLVQQVEGNILYPMVVGPRLRLHPLMMLLALAAGGVLAGIAGAFLAAPVAAVCGALLNYSQQQRESAVVIPPNTS